MMEGCFRIKQQGVARGAWPAFTSAATLQHPGMWCRVLAVPNGHIDVNSSGMGYRTGARYFAACSFGPCNKI